MAQSVKAYERERALDKEWLTATPARRDEIDTARAIARGFLECPTCHRISLTASEKAHGYHCRGCTALAEGPI